MLYPLKFKPIYKDKVWGGQRIRTVLQKDFGKIPNCGESWEISGLRSDVSVVTNGYLKGNTINELIEIYMYDLVGEHVYKKFGDEFPLLIKFIDASEWLSLQVHPNDELATQRHHAYGKTEMWYIIHAEKDAEIINGFNTDTNKESFLFHLNNKTINSILNFRKIKSGDVVFIPSGKIHATGPGILLAEIQQSSDITYRLYDWDRELGKGEKKRELHVPLALDAINYSAEKNSDNFSIHPDNIPVKLAGCEYFTVYRLNIDKPLNRDFSGADSFVIYMCIKGTVNILSDNNEPVEIATGETALIPASIQSFEIIPEKKSEVLEIYT